MYGAVEMPTASYPARTAQNVKDSDATLWFGHTDSPGAKATLHACRELGKVAVEVRPDGLTTPRTIADWLQESPHIKTLNVAGNRESMEPGMGAKVERFLRAAFRRFGHERVECPNP
jgi:hypothetical protein